MGTVQRSLLLLSCFLAGGSAATAQVKPAITENSSSLVEQVAEHLIGVMDTAEQAASQRDRVNVQITTCEVHPTMGLAENSRLLYQEQALATSVDQPYRQRFLRLQVTTDNQVESQAYRPAEPAQWVGLCDRPFSERQVGDLGDYTCSVFLVPSVLGFFGTTPPQGCPTEVRGARSVTNAIVLHRQGMDTWDRGFDADGDQVWGAADEPYRFRWRDRP
ncbi:MAG: chromophore lyase CpcT/CpeT [Almyronema sp.]